MFSRITAGNCAVSGVVRITLVETVTEIQTQELSRGNYFAKQSWQISIIFTEQNFIFAADILLEG